MLDIPTQKEVESSSVVHVHVIIFLTCHLKWLWVVNCWKFTDFAQLKIKLKSWECVNHSLKRKYSKWPALVGLHVETVQNPVWTNQNLPVKSCQSHQILSEEITEILKLFQEIMHSSRRSLCMKVLFCSGRIRWHGGVTPTGPGVDFQLLHHMCIWFPVHICFHRFSLGPTVFLLHLKLDFSLANIWSN